MYAIMCNRKYRLEDSDQMLTGQVPDISPLLKYKFNEPVYYKETQTRFGPGSAWVLGRNGSQRGTCHDVQDPDGEPEDHCAILHTYCYDQETKNLRIDHDTGRLQCSSHQQKRRLRKGRLRLMLPTFRTDLHHHARWEGHSDRFIGTTGRGPFRLSRQRLTYDGNSRSERTST
jgi:hypothetical protein